MESECLKVSSAGLRCPEANRQTSVCGVVELRSEIACTRIADAGDIRIDDQWVSDAIRRIRRARWLPHGPKRKQVDHPV